MRILPPYTQEQLIKAGMTKRELIKRMQEALVWATTEAYDPALPQGWLDEFVRETGLDYHLVLSTTVWVYGQGDHFGKPISGCVEVQREIENWKPGVAG